MPQLYSKQNKTKQNKSARASWQPSKWRQQMPKRGQIRPSHILHFIMDIGWGGEDVTPEGLGRGQLGISDVASLTPQPARFKSCYGGKNCEGNTYCALINKKNPKWIRSCSCERIRLSIIQVKSHLVPAHVGGSLNHVVSVPSGDGDEGHSGGVVSDLDKCNMSATISIQYYSCNYWLNSGA